MYSFVYLFSCRAPVLVALALIESGMEYEDAVHFIRLWVPNSAFYSLVQRDTCSVYMWHIQYYSLLAHISYIIVHRVSLMLSESVAERSTPSSCTTWKTTNLNCVCAPKMLTGRAVLFNRNRQPPLPRLLWDFPVLMTCFDKIYYPKQSVKIISHPGQGYPWKVESRAAVVGCRCLASHLGVFITAD